LLLNDTPQFADACAAWDFAEWGCHMKNASLDKTRERFRESAKDRNPPLVWVANRSGKPIGMVTLTREDHPDLQHLVS
jgi:hypothetical protein